MPEQLKALKARAAEVGHLSNTLRVLEWDMQTYMPPGGSSARAEQIGMLSRLVHERFTDPATGKLIESAQADLNGAGPDSDDARLVRNVRRDFDRAVKIPTDLMAEFGRHAALSESVWLKARAGNDFASFAPSLEKTFELLRQMAGYLGYEDDPYDALLDAYERGAKTSDITAMFADLRPFLVELTRAIVENGDRNREALPAGVYPARDQDSLTRKIVELVGYDTQRGRQDQAAHPFCTSFSRDDVRITTRFNESHLEGALYASLHEAGHALYEQGSPAQYDNTPLGGGASMGFHESQSRLWENLVGRSRAFSRFVFPILMEVFPDRFAGFDAERLYRAVNRVSPSLIRVEADEVTYDLHILLRFELERELLADRLKVRDLPEAWNAKMQEYLGITPPDDSQGVLQDIHWAGGMVGYFPTYSIGNVLSAQLWTAIIKAIPDVESQVERGEFAPLLEWLRENVHQYGRKFLPDELIRRATGEPLSTESYRQYLQTKFGELYGLS